MPASETSATLAPSERRDSTRSTRPRSLWSCSAIISGAPLPSRSRVVRVSSATIRSAPWSVARARGERSPALPIGVATTNSAPSPGPAAAVCSRIISISAPGRRNGSISARSSAAEPFSAPMQRLRGCGSGCLRTISGSPGIKVGLMRARTVSARPAARTVTATGPRSASSAASSHSAWMPMIQVPAVVTELSGVNSRVLAWVARILGCPLARMTTGSGGDQARRELIARVQPWWRSPPAARSAAPRPAPVGGPSGCGLADLRRRLPGSRR